MKDYSKLMSGNASQLDYTPRIVTSVFHLCHSLKLCYLIIHVLTNTYSHTHMKNTVEHNVEEHTRVP